MRNRDNALSIFLAGVRSVLPEKLVTDTLRFKGQVLVAGSHEISLEGIKNIWVIGAGKASAAMGHYVECILGNRSAADILWSSTVTPAFLKRSKSPKPGIPSRRKWLQGST
jgi:glycerate-2-kinase